MQFKPITAIIVLLLVVASLLVAGCTTSNTSTTNQTPSATSSEAAHNTTLEKYLTAFKANWYADKNVSIKAWEVSWINSTSAKLERTALNKTTNYTVNGVTTYIIFPTTQEATQYLNAMTKTNYSLASTIYTGGTTGAYYNVTSHAPTVYKDYSWDEGNQLEYKLHDIQQFDNIVVVSTGKALS
jgi:outer membrane murein-binding lipoprotein Lpp